MVCELVGLLPPGDHEYVMFGPVLLLVPFKVTVGEVQVMILFGPASALGNAVCVVTATVEV